MVETISPVGYLSKSNFLETHNYQYKCTTVQLYNRELVIGKNSLEVSVLSDSDDLSHVNIYKSNIENGFQFYLGQANPVNEEYIALDQLVLPERTSIIIKLNQLMFVAKNMIYLSI